MKEPKYAIIYPFLRDHIERILRGKDVVCKYTGKWHPNIISGSRVIFYASGGSLELLGEGTIRTLEFLTPGEIISTYGRRLFLSKAELERYRGTRPAEQKLLVVTLSQVNRFPKPVKMLKSITMAGKTLDKEQYTTILRR
jgi:hypothetical protein